MNQETSSKMSSIDKALKAHKVLFELNNERYSDILTRLKELEEKDNDKIAINTTAIGNHISEKYGLGVEELNKRMLKLEFNSIAHIKLSEERLKAHNTAISKLIIKMDEIEESNGDDHDDSCLLWAKVKEI